MTVHSSVMVFQSNSVLFCVFSGTSLVCLFAFCFVLFWWCVFCVCGWLVCLFGMFALKSSITLLLNFLMRNSNAEDTYFTGTEVVLLKFSFS